MFRMPMNWSFLFAENGAPEVASPLLREAEKTDDNPAAFEHPVSNEREVQQSNDLHNFQELCT